MVKVSVPTVEYKEVLEKDGGWYVRLFPKVDGDMTVAYEAYQRTEPTAEDIEELRQKCLADAKRYKIAEISSYDVSDAVNGFKLNGHTAWLSKDTRVGLVNSTNATIAAGQLTITLWLGPVSFVIGCQETLEMLNALERYALACYNVTASHKAAVNALTDIEDVEAFDITADYPEQLEFNVETA